MVKGIGDITIKSLIGYCGSAEEVFNTKQSALEKIPGVGPKIAKSIVNHSAFERAEQEQKLKDLEKKRKGRRSTILTGTGLNEIEDANIDQKTLLG